MGVTMPQFADLEITRRCNMACDFCFGSDPCNELSVKDIKSIIDDLAASGFTSIVFSGGEPFVRTDFEEILEYAHNLGFYIVVSTNGTFVEEKLDSLNSYVDWLGLPIEGPCPEVNDFLRQPGHFNTMMNILQMIRRGRLGPKIKIGTVVCKYNIDHLERIASIVANTPIHNWKLYQFTPRERGKVNKSSFMVSDEHFHDRCMQIVRSFSAIPMKISSIVDRNKAYFLIRPDGSVVTPHDDHYEFLGNILAQGANDIWRSSQIDKASHRRNFGDTYPSPTI